MKKKLTPEEYDSLIKMKPEERVSDFNDPLTNKIMGILVGYSKFHDMRDGWIDIITTRDAEREIRELIIDCGGSLELKKI